MSASIGPVAKDVEDALAKHASDADGIFLQRFFKAGQGQYGEGDVFIGVRVPMTRQVCKTFKDLPLPEVQKLLDSPVHGHRLAGLILLANKYPKASQPEQEKIFKQYLNNVYQGRVNNWDLVDTSAEHIIGAYLVDRPPGLLFELAMSDNIWQRRVAILSSYKFIKNGDALTTLDLAEFLLHDREDLIQKAVGWMLREIGKRVDRQLLLQFLDKHAATMPRTALRYALEHLSTEQRTYYMKLGSHK